MTTLVLIRNGKTDWNKEDRIQGTLDVPLNEQGREQARKIAKEIDLPMEIIYTSELSRAYESADIINEEFNLKVKKLKELNELNQGMWQGLLVEEARKRYTKIYSKWESNPMSVSPPKGESLAEAHERIITTLGKIVRKHSSACVGLVVHKVVIGLIKSYYLQLELDNLWNNLPEAGSWEALKVKEAIT